MRRWGLTRRTLARLALAALCTVSALPSAAQTVTSATAAQLAGPDRTERLIAGAKREGRVTVYSSAALEDLTPLIAAFETKYGVDVRLWRGGSDDILQRALTESRARRHEVDVIETSITEMEALAREGLFEPVRSPVFAQLMPDAYRPNRPWVGTRVFIYLAAYNTKLVRPEDAPKTYQDLLHPRWKGRLGIEGSDSNWFMTLVNSLGDERGLSLFSEIARRNGLSARRGHTLLSNLVISGEVPLALNVYLHEVASVKQAGAPIQEVYLTPTIAQMAAGGVMKRAPHPHAAVLFLDFVLTDGQKIWADLQRVPTNLTYQRLPAGVNLTFIDADKYVAESTKWERLYREIVTSRAR